MPPTLKAYRRGTARLIVVGALVMGMAVTVPVALAQEPVTAVETSAVFNDPGDDSQQHAISDRIIELIEGAADDSQIRMSMFYAKDPAIPEALVAAHERGVAVQVIFDASSQEDFGEVYQLLADAVGENTEDPSFVTTCPAGRGCVGTREMGGVTALNHNKFLLFSQTAGAANVIVQSSANLNPGRDGPKGWNNALVLAGHDDIYRSYDEYFEDQIAADGDDNYYDTRTPVTQDGAKIHYYPRHESGSDPYNDPSEDTISTLLDNVECTGNAEVGTPEDHRTILRVNQSIFSRTYLADKLVELDDAGCEVEVVVTLPDNNDLAVQSLESLLAATDSSFGGVKTSYFCAADEVWTHSKYLALEGKYYGEADRKITWTGSANFSTNSLRQSDETLLQFEDDAIHDDYANNFAATFAAATHQPSNGDAIAC